MSNYLPTHQHTAACGHYNAPSQPPACTHPHYPQPASHGAGKWLAIGIGGSFLAVALSVSMVAFAIGAVALTICVVILRSVWNDFAHKG